MAKQSIVIKNDKKMRISHIELGPYLNEEFGFIDPDFPHVYSSINQNDLPPNEEIQWIPAEYLQKDTNYSEDITNLETNLFHKKSISHALIITNWFQKNSFNDIFYKDLSQIHLYSYFVMVDGIFMHIPIDSYIPVISKTKQTLFTPKYKNSIFPCLYEKVLAKIYGDYYSITSEFIDIIELQTLFCRQEISLTSNIKKQDLVIILQNKINSKSIVGFRTRNSIRLESFGLQSNYVYIIIRVLQKEEDTIIQFLEIDIQSWIGKHSKLRSAWQLQEEFVIKNEIIRTEQNRQNYMSIEDMKGIGRQLIILNNTNDFHKNYYSSQKNANYFSMFKIHLNEVNNCMIRVNFKHKKCYNGVYIIKKVGNINKLVSSKFNQNKSSNYLQSYLQPGQYNLIIYNTHSQQQCLPFNLTLYSSEEFIDIVPVNNHPEILEVLQSCFLNYFSEKKISNNEGIVFRQLYNLTGFAFIYIKPIINPLTIVINSQMLQQRKIFCLNYKTAQKQLALTFPIAKQGLIIYKCLWSKKQNIDFDTEDINSRQQIEKISFPPIGSIKVYQKIKK